jgi:hypothetical protein
VETLRLAAIRFFADLPEDELAAVASMAAEAEIPPGQLLASEGRVGYSLYAIESGTADVVINGETVGTIGAGDERRAQDAERALGNQRAPGEQGDSPGSDPPVGT